MTIPKNRHKDSHLIKDLLSDRNWFRYSKTLIQIMTGKGKAHAAILYCFLINKENYWEEENGTIQLRVKKNPKDKKDKTTILLPGRFFYCTQNDIDDVFFFRGRDLCTAFKYMKV